MSPAWLCRQRAPIWGHLVPHSCNLQKGLSAIFCRELYPKSALYLYSILVWKCPLSQQRLRGHKHWTFHSAPYPLWVVQFARFCPVVHETPMKAKFALPSFYPERKNVYKISIQIQANQFFAGKECTGRWPFLRVQIYIELHFDSRVLRRKFASIFQTNFQLLTNK